MLSQPSVQNQELDKKGKDQHVHNQRKNHQNK